MIVILCDSWQDACDAYDIFVSFLECYEPMSIVETNNFMNGVLMDDDLRYTFVDINYLRIFEDLAEDVPMDILERVEFFEDFYDRYNLYVQRDWDERMAPW